MRREPKNAFFSQRFARLVPAWTSAASLSGCEIFRREIEPWCSNDPRITDPAVPLAIDSHVHVFNGSDLQVNAFLSRARHIKGLGPILQKLAWAGAPTGDEELEELVRIADRLKACDRLQADWLDTRSDEQYKVGRQALIDAADQLENENASLRAESSKAVRQIRDLPERYSDYKSRKSPTAFRSDPVSSAIEGALAFILRNFQFRYVNIFDYLFEYSKGRHRKVDLMICHLVNYDWPIAGGTPTLTSIPKQIELMAQISVLTSGRVHCFVPFDPFKQIAFDLGEWPYYSPLEEVVRAVAEKGFLGVKLYPTMGFQAYGNSGRSPEFWNRDWIPAVLRRPDINVRLDGALKSLYEWCASNGVPIMAHSARSNSPTPDFEDLSGAKGWQEAVRCFPGLRVNFGHFGETSPIEKGTDRAKSFMSLMNTHAGRHLYADSGYFTEAVSRPQELTAILRTLFESTRGKGSAALAQRFLYGTDWEMIVLEGGGVKNYLKDFEQIFSILDQDPNFGAQGKLSDRFFSANAANYLGIHPGDPNRTRLETFYGRSRITHVGWMPKVDRCCGQRMIARKQ